jgi:hypothetical protein
MQMKVVAIQPAGVVEMEHELCPFPGKHRFDVPGVYLQLRHVAEGVQHGHAGSRGEQEGEDVTQAQVVIDVAQQHHHQHKGKAESLAGRNDVDAALVEYQRAGLDAAAERPVAEQLSESGKHSFNENPAQRFDRLLARKRERIVVRGRARQFSY